MNKNFSSQINGMNTNLNKEDLINAAKSGNTEKLIEGLSKEDKQKLNSILNDQSKLEEVFKNPKARALFKMLSGGK